MLAEKIPVHGQPEHLLWCLIFLKQYKTENQNHALVKADEKTIRKWVWIFVDLIANLKVVIEHKNNYKRFNLINCYYFQVKLENRYDGADSESYCFNSLDGTDYRIYQKMPFDRKWYSHKFHGPGLRYEIALCIKTGFIVWANGPYPCGRWPDLSIARDCYVNIIDDGEMTVADLGYRDSRYFITPNRENSSIHKKVMARHETVNRRMKQFNVLGQVFRHPLHKHARCFRAVLNITQISIRNGEALYDL
jgi:hypothetical protein